MKANLVTLVASLAIFVHYNSAIAGSLKCQSGVAFLLEGTDDSRISNCTPSDQYCFEATCAALDQPGNIRKDWTCFASTETGNCGLYENTMMKRTKSKKVSCQCKYGEKGKNLTNVPSSAAENRLRCKAGAMNVSGTGKIYYSDCIDGYNYCYAAYCSKAKWKEHVQTMWGCSKDASSCNALSGAVSAQLESAVKCECIFGAMGVSYGNKNFPLTTTSTQKPTTSITTTTTTKTTTKTTTTTTKKSTTKTTTMTKEKPTMTLKGPMPISGQLMTTTAEVSRSVCHSFAIWTLLVALGILA
uniref:Activin_recp domain-containing protein n=2 Tax=Globodera pallida TaxID=36090 RepID=A0A183CLP6_GLOPA